MAKKKPTSIIGVAKRGFDIAGKAMSGHYIDPPESGKRTIQADAGEDAAEAQAPAPKPKKKPKQQDSTTQQTQQSAKLGGSNTDILAAYDYVKKEDGKILMNDIVTAMHGGQYTPEFKNLLKVLNLAGTPDINISNAAPKYNYLVIWKTEDLDDVTGIVEASLEKGMTVEEIISLIHCRADVVRSVEGSLLLENVEDQEEYNRVYAEYIKGFMPDPDPADGSDSTDPDNADDADDTDPNDGSDAD